MRRRQTQPRATRRREPSTALGKPSVRAGADDRFAQFEAVGLTIALATRRKRRAMHTSLTSPDGAPIAAVAPGAYR
jgi:hypothetical protein